jgi:S1-C subfamily serine protease
MSGVRKHGAGILVPADGLVVTVHHVVEGANHVVIVTQRTLGEAILGSPRYQK